MPTATSISNIIEDLVHLPEEVAKLINNPVYPTKVEGRVVINQSTINLVNIPNPDCVGGAFGFLIIVITHEEWINAENVHLNKVNKTTVIKTCCQEDTVGLTAIPPQVVNPANITFPMATKAAYNVFPTYANPGKYVIDTSWSAEDATIIKIKHKINQKIFV